MFLELAGEMLGIVETETFGSLRDSGSAHQELLGTLHDEAADMGGGRVARQFTDQVTDSQKRFGCDTDARSYQRPRGSYRLAGGVVRCRLQVPAEPAAVEQLQHRWQYLTEPRPRHQTLR